MRRGCSPIEYRCNFAGMAAFEPCSIGEMKKGLRFRRAPSSSANRRPRRPPDRFKGPSRYAFHACRNEPVGALREAPVPPTRAVHERPLRPPLQLSYQGQAAAHAPLRIMMVHECSHRGFVGFRSSFRCRSRPGREGSTESRVFVFFLFFFQFPDDEWGMERRNVATSSALDSGMRRNDGQNRIPGGGIGVPIYHVTA